MTSLPSRQSAGRPPRTLPARPWVLLLVDDEPDILQSAGDLLEQGLRGLRVLRASSGRQGLEILQTERVDAILSDFRMTGMDGIEFLYLARRMRPRIPRSMFTAFASEELARRAEQEAEVQSFVSKAQGPEEFVEQVALMLTYTPSILPAP